RDLKPVEFPTAAWERLVRLVPGLSGYQGREKIREADKIFRVTLAEQLAQLQRRLEEMKKTLVERRELHPLPQLDLLTRRMAQSKDAITYASYGYSGAFDLAHLGTPELERIYRFDLSLAEQLEGLGRRVEAFCSQAGREGIRPEAIQELERVLQEFMDHLARRGQVPKG
ncbi:MAG: hypothetical protein QHH30_11690, partial [candidate division NC10 bacterium]|nr:hypothetical protein [candidate division NC10 bacterium]